MEVLIFWLFSIIPVFAYALHRRLPVLISTKVRQQWLLKAWIREFLPHNHHWSGDYSYPQHFRGYELPYGSDAEWLANHHHNGNGTLAKRIGWTYNCQGNLNHGDVRSHIIPICGWEWLEQHEHDLDSYIPHVEFSWPGARYTFNLRDQSKMKSICSVAFKGKKELREKIRA